MKIDSTVNSQVNRQTKERIENKDRFIDRQTEGRKFNGDEGEDKIHSGQRKR